MATTGSAPARTVADLLRAAAATDPDAVGLVDGTRRWTWRELSERASAVAAGLVQAGLSPGDRLAVALASGADFVTCYLGGLRAGLVVVPVNPGYTQPELQHVLRDSGSALLVTRDTRQVPALVRTPEQLDGATGADVAVQSEDTAVLLYTSGTSGVPKGAVLSHRALLANLQQIGRIEPPLLTAEDIALVPLPLFHVFGLNAGLGLALAHRARIVTMERFDADRAVALAESERATLVLGAPAVFAALAAHPRVADALRHVRLALSGSAPLPAELLTRYAELGVPLHEGYGLSETAPVVTSNVVDPVGRSCVGRPLAGSIGFPIPGVSVELRDVDGSVVDDGDPGLLAVRGDNLFSGYWPDRHAGPDAEGWFVTGDLAVSGAAGELYLVGRDSDLVLVNGFNVYPAEVEAVLRQADGVSAVAVVGVPDETTGEAVHAYIVPAAGARVDAAALLAGAARSLARFKLPREIEVVDSLPLTVTGKVKKWQLTTTT